MGKHLAEEDMGDDGHPLPPFEKTTFEDPNSWIDDAVKESQKHNRHSLDLLEAGMDETNPKDLIGMTKAPLELVPPAAIIHMAMAMKNGAAKYGPYNWRDKKVQAMVYIGAAQRHLLSYLDREDDASDSGVHHLAHAMACLGILLDAFETGNLIDNRPTKGVAAELLERFTEKRDG